MDPFKDIRPYTDSEVAKVLESLISNPSVLKALIGLQFPGIISKVPFIKFFVKQQLLSRVKTIHSIDDYQQVFKGLMEKVVQESISTFSVDGLKELNQNDINIHMTGGETADVGDIVRTIIVDSTVVARMNKNDVIDNSNIKDGNVIIGLASYGKSSYEKVYNSGMGSNGLTSARHDVFSNLLAEKYPESFDPGLPEELVYSGTKGLTDKFDEVELDAGKMVLSPTRTYAPVIKKILKQIGNKNINGIVHCSGGAQTKILHFISNDLHVIKDSLFEPPFLFRLIQSESNTDWKEMYKVFNCGHRMELYVDPKFADKIISISHSFDIEAKIIGRVEKSKSKKLSIKSEFGEFNY